MKDRELDQEIAQVEQELKDSLEKVKRQYEAIEIPEELSKVIINNVQGRKKKEVIHMKKYYLAAIPAAAVIIFTAGLNTSYSFASAMEEVPVLGTVAKVLTIRSYQEKDADKEMDVTVPKVEVNDSQKEEGTENSEAVGKMVEDVNAEIDKAIAEYVKGAETRIEEYKQAFLETGGTEEEFAEKNIQVNVDYEVKHQDENYLSFVVTGNESWIGAYAVNYYYNLDMKSGQQLTLKDLLGEDYVETANSQILSEMQKRTAENEDYMYFDEDSGGFTTVTEDDSFYINEAGNPVIVFEKYEVAPGFMGPQEFEIVR